MKKYDIKHLPIKSLFEAAKETTVELNGVITALGGKYHGKKTIVTYNDGSVVEYDIKGVLGQNSIPNKNNIISVEIGRSVTNIAPSAFQSNNNLRSVFIPGTVTINDNDAWTFANCSSLLSVTIENGVNCLGACMFRFCKKLSNIIIPNSITSISTSTFLECNNLSSVTIGNNVKKLGDSAFSGCSKLSSITIPDGVTDIGGSAFCKCTSLSSISIGTSISIISGSQTFAFCPNLSSITCLATTAPTVQSNTFGVNSNGWTGRNTYNTGHNVLKVPLGAIGYNQSSWSYPLQNAYACGFHIEYI